MDSPQAARIHATVSGYVQGVGFRFFTMQSAWTHELTGWVRNRINGDVEVIAEGKREALESLISDLKKGPTSASVTNVEVEWLPYKGEFTTFEPVETA